ncbi:MAG: peroxiredoxin family protein [Nitrospinota bacterium]
MKRLFRGWRLWLIGGLLASLSLALWFLPQAPAKPRVGVHPLMPVVMLEPSAAPTFKLPDLNGSHRTLEDFRGSVIFLNFFATWCPPCRKEMPQMDSLYKKYKDRGLTVLALSVDTEEAGVVSEFVGELSLSFPVLHDKERRAALLYRVVGLPTSYFIDRKGNLFARSIGQKDWGGANAEKFIEELLEDY